MYIARCIHSPSLSMLLSLSRRSFYTHIYIFVYILYTYCHWADQNARKIILLNWQDCTISENVRCLLRFFAFMIHSTCTNGVQLCTYTTLAKSYITSVSDNCLQENSQNILTMKCSLHTAGVCVHSIEIEMVVCVFRCCCFFLSIFHRNQVKICCDSNDNFYI